MKPRTSLPGGKRDATFRRVYVRGPGAAKSSLNAATTHGGCEARMPCPWGP